MLSKLELSESIVTAALLGLDRHALSKDDIPEAFQKLQTDDPLSDFYQVAAALMLYESSIPNLEHNSFSLEETFKLRNYKPKRSQAKGKSKSQAKHTSCESNPPVQPSKASSLAHTPSKPTLESGHGTSQVQASDASSTLAAQPGVFLAYSNSTESGSMQTAGGKTAPEIVADNVQVEAKGTAQVEFPGVSEVVTSEDSVEQLLERWKDPHSPLPMIESSNVGETYFSEAFASLVLQLLPFPWLLFSTLRQVENCGAILPPQHAFEMLHYFKNLQLNKFAVQNTYKQLYSQSFDHPLFSGFTLRRLLFKLGGVHFSYILNQTNIYKVSTVFSHALPQESDPESYYSKLWSKSQKDERIGIWIELRWLMPQLSRQLLSKTIDKLKSQEAQHLIKTMQINLSVEDEELLLKLWQSRSREIKDLAMQTLRLLPDSSLALKCRQLVLEHVSFTNGSWQFAPFELERDFRAWVIPTDYFNRRLSTERLVGFLLEWCDLGTLLTLGLRGLAYYGHEPEPFKLKVQAQTATQAQVGVKAPADARAQQDPNSIGYVGLFTEYEPEQRREMLHDCIQFLLEHYQIFGGIIYTMPSQCIGVKVVQAQDPLISQVFMQLVQNKSWQSSFEALVPDLPSEQLTIALQKRNIQGIDSSWIKTECLPWSKDFALQILNACLDSVTYYLQTEMADMLCFSMPDESLEMVKQLLDKYAKKADLLSKFLERKGLDPNVVRERQLELSKLENRRKLLSELHQKMQLKLRCNASVATELERLKPAG